MRVIPVDDRRMKVLVLGEPTPQERDGEPVLDRVTKKPLWNIPVAVISPDGRAETTRISVPEGGFPKGLGMAMEIHPEEWVTIVGDKNGRSWDMDRAVSVKVEGGAAGMKAAA